MGVFGVDVSNYQASFNFSGWDFAFIKATQGNWFKDGRFNQHLTNARNAGCLVAAYHYQETSSVASQVANIKAMVPQGMPVIIDVERGSGGLDITRSLVDTLRAEGYTVPFVYIPRWYWREIGSPDMSGLPNLWASWYPDYVARPRDQALAMVPGSAWTSYGGLSVGIMQFTSTPFDQDWFPGTRDQLAAILNGRAPGGGSGDDFLMALTQEQQQYIYDSLVDLRTDLGIPYTTTGQSTGNVVKYLYEAVQDIRNDLAKPYLANNKSSGEVLRDLEGRLTALEDLIKDIQVGGVDYDRLAEVLSNKIFDSLDVDIVRRDVS